MQRNIQPGWKQTFGFPEAITAKSTKSKRRNRKISEKKAKKKQKNPELQDEINFTHGPKDPPSAKSLMSPATSAEKQIILSERASRNQSETSKTSESCEL